MRALWTGSLNFGLINIPVKLHGVTQERGGIELDMLHRSDLMPIRYVRVCTEEGEEVPLKDIVKGYEYREGAYVTLEEEDFERANLQATKSIDIHEFTDESAIDPLYYDKPYVLLPMTGGERSYAVLRGALERTGKVGIATFVLRGRGRIGFIKAHGGGLILERLRYKDEVRDPSTFDLPAVVVGREEADIAAAFVQMLSRPFRIEEYRDTYTEELRKVIDEKVRGRQPPIGKAKPAPEPTGTADLMRLLRASLEGAKGGRFRQPKKRSSIREAERIKKT